MSEIINQDRRRFMGAAAMTIAAARFGVACSGAEQMAAASGKLPIEGRLPSFRGAGVAQLAAADGADLRGKVVLVDFWTYTCINWLRRCRTSAPGPKSTRSTDWW